MVSLSDADRLAVSEALADVVSPVRLLFFTQSLGCETCAPTRRILDQVAELNGHITIEEVNLVLDKERVSEYRIDRAPAIALVGERDTGIRFYGAPAGYEFMSLLEAIRLASSGDSGLSEDSRALLAGVNEPLHIQVFVTPTCSYCPRAVNLADRMAVESAFITAVCIEATEFPDLVRRYRVTGVPKTVVNDRVEILGAVPERDFVRQVLQALEAPPD